jgi:type III restriction enzyme
MRTVTMARKAKINKAQTSFLENYGPTAPAVPAIREAMLDWRATGYKGATETTRLLLNHWFHTDHKRPDGAPFAYYNAQQDALETMVYVYEVARTRTLRDLYQTFIPREMAPDLRLPELDDSFARYATKMATGSGKTKVMSLAIAWQYFNAVLEDRAAYARTFLIIAPNVIVFERLKTDFGGGLVFRTDPIVPRSLQIYWEMQFYMRGESERASSTGALYLTNIQQLYERDDTANSDEPGIMTAMLGPRPPASLHSEPPIADRIAARDGGPVLVINDEAHHTHDDTSAWNAAIRNLHAAHPGGLAAQLDFSATPRYSSGSLFAWTISDYTLKQAIIDGIVKRPIKGVADIQEGRSDIPSRKYAGFIIAGVERWREYCVQLEPLGKQPLLFIMMNDTKEADSIGDMLRTKWPEHFAGEKTLVIHTKRNGDITQGDLEDARRVARDVDDDRSPVNAIVSVLMLREGWDVQNVTVIVGLRPYTSKANILPEQTIGRGLRLMFRSTRTAYRERVDIIGNPGFIDFIEQLEADEGLKLDQWRVGKEKLVITTIHPEPERADYDIALPVLSPLLERKTQIAEIIAGLDITTIYKGNPLPIAAGESETETFTYEGKDFLTNERLFERHYEVPPPQTSGEIISYFAQDIASDLKLPSQFNVIAPRVREFLTHIAFGATVDLELPALIEALDRALTQYVVRDSFVKALRPLLIEDQQPILLKPGRLLSGTDPFPWGQDAPVCAKTIFNKVPCDNAFEARFARFLDNASDVARFAKLPLNFGFTIPYTDSAGNMRNYYPDFVAVDAEGAHILIETKGREDLEVSRKDASAHAWCERASELTGTTWRYAKVLQTDFEAAQLNLLADCLVMASMRKPML